MNIIHETPEQLKAQTSIRRQKMFREFRKEPKLKVFSNTENYDQIIAQVGIPVSGLCEHHKVAFEAEVSIAYIPDKFLIGLSKFARVAEFYLNPTLPTLQERATHQILNSLQKALEPKGIMVIIKGRHTCIGYRGVKKPSLTITSAIKGIFETEPHTKQEFLQLIK